MQAHERRVQYGKPGHWAEPEGTEPLRILLAEDDFEMRRMLAAALRREGYEVVEAQTGGELLDALAEYLLHPITRPPFDLIISDQRMPGLMGLEVLGGMRDDDRATPFILITAFGGEALRNEALRVGATAVFDKPFDLDDLRMAVMNLIGRPGTGSAGRRQTLP